MDDLVAELGYHNRSFNCISESGERCLKCEAATEIDRLNIRIQQLEPQEGDQFFSRANMEEALKTAILPFETEVGRLQEVLRRVWSLLEPGGTTLELSTNRRLASRVCFKEGAVEEWVKVVK